jgi:hypothetical protein
MEVKIVKILLNLEEINEELVFEYLNLELDDLRGI